jgi:hypothetical protein
MPYDAELINKSLNRTRANFIMPTDDSISRIKPADVITKRGIKNFGLENSEEGFFNILGENVIAGSKNIAGSIAATFGNTSFAATMEAQVELNRDFDEKTIKDNGFSAWLGQSLGQAVPDITGAIAAGVVTGGLGAPAALGSGAFSFIRMQGANYRTMRNWRPDADVKDVRAASAMLSLVQAAVEQAGGLEALGAKKILAGRTVSEVADEMIKEAAKNETMTFMQRALVSSKNRAMSVAKGAIAEMGEESIQGAAELIAGATWGGQTYTADDLLRALVFDPARALPAGGLMGGVFHVANQNGKAAAGLPVITDTERAAIFSIQTEDGPVLDTEAMARDDAAFDALNVELKKQFGASSIAGTEAIKSMCYVYSFVAQTAHNKRIMPADFINDFKMAFINSNLSRQQVERIDDIRRDTSLTSQDRGEKILEYIDSEKGKDSPVYKAIRGVGQVVEASDIKRSTDDIISTLNRYAPTLDTESHDLWKSTISENIERAQGIGTGNALIPGRTRPESMTYNEVGEHLSRDDIARIFIEEPIIKIGGIDYSVRADDVGLSFVEASESSAQFDEIVSELIDVMNITRKKTRATGGDELLAREKAMHGIMEQKIFIGNVLDSYDNRQSAGAYEEQKMRRLQSEKIAAEDASLKNAQTEALKQGEIEEGVEITREIPEALAAEATARTALDEQVKRVESINYDVEQTTAGLLAAFAQLQEKIGKEPTYEETVKQEADKVVADRELEKARGERIDKYIGELEKSVDILGAEFVQGNRSDFDSIADAIKKNNAGLVKERINILKKKIRREMKRLPKEKKLEHQNKKKQERSQKISELESETESLLAEFKAVQESASLDDGGSASITDSIDALKREHQKESNADAVVEKTNDLIAAFAQLQEKLSAQDDAGAKQETGDTVKDLDETKTGMITKPFAMKGEARDPYSDKYGWHGEIDGTPVHIFRDTEQFGYTKWYMQSDEKIIDLFASTKSEAIESATKYIVGKESEAKSEKSKSSDLAEKTKSLRDSFKKLQEEYLSDSTFSDVVEDSDESSIGSDIESKLDELEKLPTEEIAADKETLKMALEYNQKVQPLVDQFKKARDNRDLAKTVELLTEIRNAQEEIGMYRYEEIVFETGDLAFDNRPVSELTDAEIMAEADKAGVIFQGWMEPVHWPEFKDPQNLGNFTAMGKNSFKQALDTHRAKDWSNMRQRAMRRTESVAGVFDSDTETVRALYIPTERTAIFFKSAGIQSVIHEFAHHAKSILPIEMQSQLIEAFNQQTGNNAIGWSVEADEWFAMSMTKWIVNKEQPFTKEERGKAGAFLLARRIVMNAYKEFDLNDQTKAELDRIFGEVPDKAAVFGAKQAMDSMIAQDPPTAAQVSALFAEKDGSRFASKEDDVAPPKTQDYNDVLRFDASLIDVESNATLTKDERNDVRKKIYATTGGRQQALEVARAIFGQDINGLGNLSDNELFTLMHVADMSQITNDVEVAAKAERDGQKLFEHAKQTFSEAGSSRIKSSDTRANKLFMRMKNKLRSSGVVGLMTVSSEMSMMKILDNMSDSGIWHNIISKPLQAARNLRSALTDQNMRHFSSVIRSRGLNMRKIQRIKVDLGGYQYTKGEACFMAVVNRMRAQDKESFIASNFSDNRAEGFRLIQEADAMAKADPEMTGFIDSIQDAFKYIYEDLKVAYKEVTGKDMGHIEWYMPFIRNNDWDDLDVVMAQLNSINARGDEYYKSSTKHMKERTGGSGARIDMSNPFGQCIRYINQASTYIAMAKTVKQVSATLRTDAAKAALKWKYGEGGGRRTNWNFVHNILTDLVLGELYHDARIKPMSEAEVWFRNARAGFSFFALAGNVSTMVKQVLSLPIGIVRSGMPIETTVRAAAEIFKLGAAVFSNSAQNIGRAISGRGVSEGYKHVLAGTRVYDLWSNYSPTLLNRHGNPETGEAQAYNFKGLMGVELAGMPLGEALMSGISTFDALTVGTLWASTFDSWVRYNKSKNGGNMLEADAMADAAAKADAMIRDSQPPSLPQDRNLLQRGNEFVKSFFMFSGATMRNYEIFMTDIVGRSHKALRNLKTNGVTEISDVLFKGEDLQSGLAIQLGIGFILPAVVAGIITRRRKPTEEELIFDIMAYPFTALPFMRGVLGCVAGVDEDVDQASTYAERAIIELTTGIKSACKAYHGDGWEGRDIQEALDGLAVMMHFPKVFARTGAAAIIQASGKGTMLEELKAQYIDPYEESDTLD